MIRLAMLLVGARALRRKWRALAVLGVVWIALGLAIMADASGGLSIVTVEAIAVGGQQFDVVCTFDCVHDMVDPLSALKAIRSLTTDGVYLWAEPNASDNPLENRNPVGKCFSAVSPVSGWNQWV